MNLAELIDSFTLQLRNDNDQQLQASGPAKDDTGKRVYGGQLMAQALSAGQMSVSPEYAVNSLHCQFLRPGSSETDVLYQVDKLRTGRTFATRAVTAIQNDRPVCHVSLSFHKQEDGPEHSASMPDVPAPETLVKDEVRIREYFSRRDIFDGYGWPMDVRFVDPMDLENPIVKEPRDQVWLGCNGTLPDKPQAHAQMFVYASDNPITTPAFNPLGTSPILPAVQAMSLNHSIWFHRPIDLSDWLLFDLRSDVACNGRGLAHANIFSRDGQMLASACQEVLMRTPQK